MTDNRNIHRFYTFLVIIISIVLTLILALLTYYINYWPTDSYVPYIPAAERLFDLPSISDIHKDNPFPLVMRGKEVLIFGIALFQRLLNDSLSLYPNILFLILTVQISAIAVYFITKRFLDHHIAFITYLLFVTCFWNYIYVLQGAHQPLVLMNALLASLCIIHGKSRKWLYLFSGLFLGLMFFSSPTAPIYTPYLLGFLIFAEWKEIKEFDFNKMFLHVLLFLPGMFLVFYWILHPNIIDNIDSYFAFINMSRSKNNFMIYLTFLSQYFVVNENLRGGGWLWIVKYFFLIMPIVFSFYLMALFYFFKKGIKQPSHFFILLISLSTPIAVEFSRVVQFGRNYYSWLIGIIGLVAYFLFYAKMNILPNVSAKIRKMTVSAVLILVSANVIFNIYIFATDIYPSRLATTFIHDWGIKNNVKFFYVYKEHPRFKNFVTFLNNPKEENAIAFAHIRTIRDARSGYILIPPISGKSIYNECREGDYQDDPYLTNLLLSERLSRYVVASFKTLGSSRIWTQEEEICTYRDLMIHQIIEADRKKGYALILDAKKLQEEWKKP